MEGKVKSQGRERREKKSRKTRGGKEGKRKGMGERKVEKSKDGRGNRLYNQRVKASQAKSREGGRKKEEGKDIGRGGRGRKGGKDEIP